MPIPTLDYECFSCAGFVWNEPNEAKPLGHWTALPGARVKGIGAVGTVAYAEHPTTEVLTVSYDLCDGRGVRRWRPGQPLPYDLFDHVAADGAILESHKAMFERMIWTHVCCRLYGWPPLPPHVQRCSMATAHVNQYPGALAKLGEVLRLPIQKDKEGDRLIKKFSIPRDPTKKDPRWRIRPEDDPADFERFCDYCDTDVRAEQCAADNMEPMTAAELEFWLVDQEINSRGIAIDREGVRACIIILRQVQERYGEECKRITGGIGPTQVEALRGWLAAQSVYLDSMDADAVEAALERDNLPADCRRVLETRALTGSASVKKLFSMENQCCADNRLRDLIVHHGARTGRPTGEGPQPLNLPRTGPKLVVCPCGKPYATVSNDSCPWCGAGPGDHWNKAQWTPEMIEPVLEIMSLGSLDMVERFFGDALLCISGCLRGLFIAAPGHDLIASDYSAIEAVVAACLAGEQWRIEAFQKDLPIYLVGASKITGTPLQTYLDYKASHGEHHPDRQIIGKVSELACLGADTQVLTISRDGGSPHWVSIVQITDQHLVYDGEYWVSHDGLISRGKRQVIHRHGIACTADHLFMVDGQWCIAKLMSELDWRRAVFGVRGLPRIPFDRSDPAHEQPVYDLRNCGPNNRFVVASDRGPILSHNCGFGGWIGSYKAFGSTEDDATIKAQILAWRAASPAIVEMWGGQWRGLPWDSNRYRELYGVEGMAVAAIQSPGQWFSYRDIQFIMWEKALRIRLPSGRDLIYRNARLVASQRRPDELTILYDTWNSNPHYGPIGWGPMETYGGRLFENCIAQGTQVLTSRGWVPIESVRIDDLVHDGVGFVKHTGLVYKGRQHCIRIDGVGMTPDHEVLTDDGWKEASQVSRPYRPKIRDADRAMRFAESPPQTHNLALEMRLRSNHATRGGFGLCRRENGGKPKLRLQHIAAYILRQHKAWNEFPSSLWGVEQYAGAMPQSELSRFCQLRRPWHIRLPRMAREFRKFLAGHGGYLRPKFGFRSERQRQGLFTKQLSLGKSTNQFQQSKVYRNDRHAGRTDVCGRGSSILRNRQNDVTLPTKERLAAGKMVRETGRYAAPVFDITNCGPRHRFVVRGDQGPFIVHNCVQAVSHCILRYAILALRAAGYPTVLHIYDEVLAEVPEGFGSLEEFERIMATLPPWARLADGSPWPIVARDGWRSKRYRKG